MFNFSNVYKRQDFYRDYDYQWIDCSDLTGVHGFCDRNALFEIEKRAKTVKSGIRFMDSGNFHYLSYVLTKKQQHPFDLVVLDHHTDMMPSRFPGLLSCGNWILQALLDETCLQHVILVGVSDELAGAVEQKYQNRIKIYTETDIMKDGWFTDFKGQLSEPVYLSVDKDVLSAKEVITDWDQGSMTFEQMELIWDLITEENQVLAVDVCGEYNSISGGTCTIEDADKKNSFMNGKILNMVYDSNAEFMHKDEKICKVIEKNLTADSNYDIISGKYVV